MTKFVYMLRTCNADGRSCNGFAWPKLGPVECTDWNPDPKCGGGLHGLLWGEGDHRNLNWADDASWQVVRVLSSDVVYIASQGGGKWKFPRGVVVFTGFRSDALECLKSFTPAKILDRAYHGNSHTGIGGISTAGDDGTATAGYAGTATAGDDGTATAGYRGTATAGNRGTATAGDDGTATAGYAGTATAGNRGTATAGDDGTATAGDDGTATAGYRGTATAGYRGTATAGYAGTATAGNRGTATAGYAGTATAGYAGTATAGNRGTATAGYAGTATAGYAGTATAGDDGTATAGNRGIIVSRWWDEKNERYRLVVGYVGENGINPNTKYVLNENHEFEEKK
jgi:hypothetical protein